ncbi:MAG: alkaline phosphatase family protein [Planctomycetota bacterium]|nr:alkaline phosphatase family protein [Planctomycetota bacterium]
MKLVIAITVGMRHKDLPNFSSLASIIEQGSVSFLTPPLPAVTCAAQATFLTGKDASAHGIVGNGWFHRDTREVRFWLQPRDLIESPTFIEQLRQQGLTVANLFWWFNMGSGADWSLTPRPEYPADGRKIPSVYGEPPELPVEMQKELGRFPLFDFWGPRAGIPSTRWIVDSAISMIEQKDPDVLMVYLPHLDYDDQRYGADSPQGQRSRQQLDVELNRLVEASRSRGADWMVLSEYGVEDVTRPIFPNRLLALSGDLQVQSTGHGELLDVHRSRAFAVCDHQLAHVHLSADANATAVIDRLQRLEGVERVLSGDQRTAVGLGHSRAGDLILLAESGCWFAYPWWQDEALAPDFARTVDIHRKPGYDPAELFVDPALRWPALKIGWRLLQKKLGMRALLDVISTDPSMVRGSHGRLPSRPELGPVMVRSWQSREPSIDARDVHDEILELLRESE